MRRFSFGLIVGLAVSLAMLALPVVAGSQGAGSAKMTGGTTKGLDPINAANEVVRFETTPAPPFGTTSDLHRNLGPGVQVDDLDNHLELKFWFVATRTCSGGSPRFQLQIDGDGDGKFNQVGGGPDQNAFGYLGDMAFGGGCPSGVWTFEDMTNAAPKWDLSQWGGSMTSTWDAMETFFATGFPSHRVVSVSVVDDSCGFAASSCGVVFFDIVSLGDLTINDHTHLSS